MKIDEAINVCHDRSKWTFIVPATQNNIDKINVFLIIQLELNNLIQNHYKLI